MVRFLAVGAGSARGGDAAPATAWSAALEQARRVTPVELPAADILDILKGEVFGVVLSDSLKDGQDVAVAWGLLPVAVC